MDVTDWLQANGPILSLIATIILVIITGIYVYLTKKILDSTVSQLKLVSNPVMGINLGKMEIGEVYGPSRRNLSIGLNLTNVGNAPAIDVLVDAEIILEFSNIQGEKVIPARFEPSSISFIRPGEEISEEDMIHNPCFGNTCITHLFDDFRESSRLNIHRIETDATKKPFNASKLRIFVYYRNNLGQYFVSSYETNLYLKDTYYDPAAGIRLEKIPKDDETAELVQMFIPRPKFHAGPISKEEMEIAITSRNGKRDLCGW